MLSFLLASALLGQNRVQYRQCGVAAVQAYSAPVYAQTYAQPYRYQYAPATVVKEIQFVAVEQDPYYVALAGSAQRAALRAKEVAAKDLDLAQQVGKLAEAVGKLTVAVQPGPVAPAPAPPKDQPPPPPKPADEPAPPPSEKVISMLSLQCAKCHTGGSSKGDFQLFTEPGKLAPLAPADLIRIDQVVYSGKMPPNAKPLATEDYSLLRAYIGFRTDEILDALKPPEK